MTRKPAERGRVRDGRKRAAAVPYAAAASTSVPKDAPVRTCRCGGRYREHPESKAAHQVVFGHRPIPGETKDNGEGAGWTG
jgi:hypothetical protein